MREAQPVNERLSGQFLALLILYSKAFPGTMKPPPNQKKGVESKGGSGQSKGKFIESQSSVADVGDGRQEQKDGAHLWGNQHASPPLKIDMIVKGENRKRASAPGGRRQGR